MAQQFCLPSLALGLQGLARARALVLVQTQARILAQILARILMKHHVIFVSRPEMEQTLREMKLDYAPDLETAMAKARAIKGENASVTVIPNGISVMVKQ